MFFSCLREIPEDCVPNFVSKPFFKTLMQSSETSVSSMLLHETLIVHLVLLTFIENDFIVLGRVLANILVSKNPYQRHFDIRDDKLDYSSS